MKAWFARQPIHRKLVLTSLLKTTIVLLLAMVTLLVIDFRRYQTAALGDVESLAQMMAESLRAAVAFDERAAISSELEPLRLRTAVQRACVYDQAGELIGHYTRGASTCPTRMDQLDRARLSAVATVEQAGNTVGHIYLDRDWAVMQQRTVAAAMTSLGILILASGVVMVMSHRLHRHVSDPIRRLALAARGIGDCADFEVPDIAVTNDELGELVTAFRGMAGRVRTASQDLTRTNEELRREIAERLRFEQERESLLRREQAANRTKDEFLATVSHELRTPLNAIVGWSQILATTTPTPETVSRAAESLYRNARVQARVIDDLIDISRIVSGKLRVDSSPLDLRTAVDAAVETLRGAADQAGTTIEVALPTQPAHMLGDLDRLKQVVWNLLSNAIKFAPGGHVRVSLRAEGDWLVLVVDDNGIGIAPEFLELVFDRFRQADSSVTRTHGGLGIGLAVVKELIERHGGTITASSAGRGRGATFTVRLPSLGGEQATPRQEAATMPSLHGISVLAIDDNADTLDLLREMLGSVGADVRTAASGTAGLQLWRERTSDVVLCDLAMPQMSGLEVLAALRELDRPAGRVTPAIAVTAQTSEEQVATAIRAGFQGYVAKPFDKEHLVRTIIAARGRV